MIDWLIIITINFLLHDLLDLHRISEMTMFYLIMLTIPFLASHISANDLAIPDTYCSPHDNSGYHCPNGMVCEKVELSRSDRGFNGFDEFGKNSILHNWKERFWKGFWYWVKILNASWIGSTLWHVINLQASFTGVLEMFFIFCSLGYLSWFWNCLDFVEPWFWGRWTWNGFFISKV